MSTRKTKKDADGPAPRPRGNGNFLVDLGLADARAPEAGFCEVVFPEFRLDTVQATAPVEPHLVLRRAATGATDLQLWWQQAREGKAPKRRTAIVDLLAEDGATPVMRWRFTGVRPVALAYSPLQALTPGLLYETITLAFERVEMGG